MQDRGRGRGHHAYVRQAGFSKIQQEEMVLRYIDEYGGIRRKDAMELCHLDSGQAYRLLSGLARKGRISKKGSKKSTSYVLNQQV